MQRVRIHQGLGSGRLTDLSAAESRAGASEQWRAHPADCRGGKVLFLVRSLHAGGAERQLVTLARELHARGRRVTVAAFYGGGTLEKELLDAGVPFRVIGKGGRWDLLRFLFRLFRVVRQEQPSIVHGYMDIANILASVTRPLVPRAKLVWGVRSSNVDLHTYDRLARVSAWIEAALARSPDLIIVNSWAGYDDRARRGFPNQSMCVVPNGIDIARFRPDPAARQRVRSEWGIAREQVLIGVVGRLDPMKDHPAFLRAAREVARQRSEVRFACIGDGPASYRLELERLAQELGIADRIVWSPARTDVPEVLNAMDWVCSSSAFGEGFSNVVGEAMACGVPCVVTDVGDSARIVDDTGFVVPPRDSGSLARALLSALAVDDLPHRKEAARNRIVANFSVDRLVEGTETALWTAD